MKQRLLSPIQISILTALLVSLLLAPATAQAAPGVGDLLLERINAARISPLGEAARIGYHADTVLTDLPQLADILENGLEPLSASDQLAGAALAHTSDMLNRDYYNKVSPEGLTPADRIAETGLQALSVGETLGVVAFQNFIAPDTAADILFRNMFAAELNPQFTGRRNILDPAFTLIGIGVDTGTLTLNGQSYNVYAATTDFAQPLSVDRTDLAAIEGNVLTLINQFRDRPLETSQTLGVDTHSRIAEAPSLAFVLTRSLPPLIASPTLEGLTIRQVEEIVQGTRGMQPLTVDDPLVQNYLLDAGYAVTAFEGAVQVQDLTDFIDTAAIAYDIAFNLIHDELINYVDHGTLRLLNASLKDVGMQVTNCRLKFAGVPVDSIISAAIFGSTGGWVPFYITGTIFNDINADHLSTIGEAVADSIVTVESHPDNPAPPLIRRTLTNASGSYMAIVTGVGPYRVTAVLPGGVEKEKVVQMNAANQWVAFEVN